MTLKMKKYLNFYLKQVKLSYMEHLEPFILFSYLLGFGVLGLSI